MEALDTRLRRRIDVLRDERDALDQKLVEANAIIEKLRSRKARAASIRDHTNQTCPYCGRAIRAKSKACSLHAHLMADDPFYSS